MESPHSPGSGKGRHQQGSSYLSIHVQLMPHVHAYLPSALSIVQQSMIFETMQCTTV